MSRTTSKAAAPANRRSLASACFIAIVLLGAFAYWTWTDTPQLAAHGEVYASLDALFTAVTARRQPLVESCERKLAMLHREGKIPEQAWRRISTVIASANRGEWESAAQQLYLFIERQKRTT